MTRRDLDVLLIVACSLVLAAIILAVPSAKAARIVLGLPFVLLFPASTPVAALLPPNPLCATPFPRKGVVGAGGAGALSSGLSPEVRPPTGPGPNYSPWGIR